MLNAVPALTAPVDHRVSARSGSSRTPFPVARPIGRVPRSGRLHLVDGDGASLCEAFPQQQLEQVHLAWEDVVAMARCTACDVMGS